MKKENHEEISARGKPIVGGRRGNDAGLQLDLVREKGNSGGRVKANGRIEGDKF